MTKPMSERTHKARVESGHKSRGLSPSQIRASKCHQSKTRNAARRAQRRADALARKFEYDKLSYKQRIRRLDVAGFTAKKEREKLAKKFSESNAA